MARPNKVKAYDGPYAEITKLADGSITHGSVVTSGTNPEDVAECTASDNPVGVAGSKTVGDNDYADGEEVLVIASGIVRLEASASISEGEKVKAAADGKVQPVSGDGTDTNAEVGTALGAASQDGDILEVKL